MHVDNPTIVSQFEPHPLPKGTRVDCTHMNLPAGAQKSLVFQICTSREPIFLGKCWHVFRPENSPAPFSGGVSDVRPKIFLTHTESGRSVFSLSIKKNENPVCQCFLKDKKTEENPVGPISLTLRKRRGQIRCGFLRSVFL